MRNISWIKDTASVVLIYALIIVSWQLAYYVFAENLALVKTYMFPNPIGVVRTFGRLFSSGALLAAIGTSLKKMLIGYAAAIVLGVGIGLLICRFGLLCRALKPLILGLQTLPSICWVPFALLWFGLNESAVIFVIVVGSAFSISIAVESAVKNVNPLYIRAARTMGAKGVALYKKVIFPASIPEVVSGLKQGWSFAWRALMAGEVISGTKGLGYVLLTGRELLDINQVMAVMITIVLISVLIENFIFGKIEKATRIKMGLR